MVRPMYLNAKGIYIVVGGPYGRWIAPLDRVINTLRAAAASCLCYSRSYCFPAGVAKDGGGHVCSRFCSGWEAQSVGGTQAGPTHQNVRWFGATTMTKKLVQLAVVFGALCAAAAAQSPSPIPSDEEIRKILVQRIDDAKQSVGIVVGVIEPKGRR